MKLKTEKKAGQCGFMENRSLSTTISKNQDVKIEFWGVRIRGTLNLKKGLSADMAIIAIVSTTLRSKY